MKKKVIIGIIAIIVIGLIAGFAVIKPAREAAKNEDLIKDEVNKLNEIAEKDFESEELNTILNRTVSSGDYVEAEKAIKAYMKDFIDMSYNVVEVLDSANIDKILSEENLTTDTPELTKTKDSLANVRAKLTEYKQTASEFLTVEKMKSYIEGKNLTDPVRDFYNNELAVMKDEDKKSLEELNTIIDKSLGIIDKEELIINYLADNKGMWTFETGLPIFTTQEKADGYNNLVQDLQNYLTNN